MRLPMNREEKKTGSVMMPVETRTISVTSKETKENRTGISILARICFKGEIGRYLTMIKAFPSLVMDMEAEELMTPEKRRIRVRLIPETSSGK